LHPEFFLDSIRARRNDIRLEVEETMKRWIKGRKRDIIIAGIGSIVAVIIWIVLLGPTFH
jgi:hypothetical protein